MHDFLKVSKIYLGKPALSILNCVFQKLHLSLTYKEFIRDEKFPAALSPKNICPIKSRSRFCLAEYIIDGLMKKESPPG
jgi:hypothetical protein